MGVSKKAPEIGTLNEGALHAALKRHYGGAEAQFEVPFSGFVADVVRDDTIFEIQTSSFSGLERKMRALRIKTQWCLFIQLQRKKSCASKIQPAATLLAANRRRRASFVTFLASWCTTQFAQPPEFFGRGGVD